MQQEAQNANDLGQANDAGSDDSNMDINEDEEMDDLLGHDDDELEPRQPHLAPVGPSCAGALKATHPLLQGNVDIPQ